MRRHAQESALFQLVRWFWREGGQRLKIGILLSAVTGLCGVALLGLSGWFISATALAGMSLVTAQLFDVFMPSAGIRLFALGRTFSRYAERLVTHDVTLSLLARLRVQLFCSWARADAARRLALRPARWLFRLTCDVDALESLFLRAWLPLSTALITVLAVSTALLLVNTTLGILVLVASLGVGALMVLTTRAAAMRPACRRANALEKLRAQCADLVAGQTELLMTNQIDAQCTAILDTEARLRREDDHLLKIDTRAALGFGVFSSGLLACVLWGAGWLVQAQAIDIPLAALVTLLTLTLAEPLMALRRGALELTRTALAARRLAPQLQAQASLALSEQGVASEQGPLRVLGSQPIVLKQCCARHDGAARDCLSEINLELAAGERVALIGSSGAGKSSLLAALTGELLVRHGTLAIDQYGWLTQRTELFRDSLRDNLLLAAPVASDEQLRRALHIAGLTESISAWPDGLATALGDGGLGLSGGQARRLALARLLLRDDPVWLLDEPTEGLDKNTARQVLARLSEQGAGRTWLLATHLQREAVLAERLVLLRDGRIVGHWRRGSHGYNAALAQLRPD